METKVCSKCGDEKELSQYYYRKDRHTYRNDCNVCINQRRKLRYVKKPINPRKEKILKPIADEDKRHRRGIDNPHTGKYKVNISYEELNKLYNIDKKSMVKIGVIYNVNAGTILNYLRKYNIPSIKYGRTPTSVTKEKMSKSHKGIKQSLEWKMKRGATRRGEKHPLYKHGLSRTKQYLKQMERESFAYISWRKSVFERDHYTCQHCGGHNDTYLEAHHIKSFDLYPNIRYEITNGITLCKECHKIITKQQMIGNTNGKRKITK